MCGAKDYIYRPLRHLMASIDRYPSNLLSKHQAHAYGTMGVLRPLMSPRVTYIPRRSFTAAPLAMGPRKTTQSHAGQQKFFFSAPLAMGPRETTQSHSDQQKVCFYS